MDVDLKDFNREQLNAYATEHYAEAIPDPTAYANKGELQKAIEAAATGEPVPPPTDQKRGGTTVTFKGCPDSPGTRSVRVDDDRFLIDTPVPHVSDEVVSTLQELDGHDFEFEQS